MRVEVLKLSDGMYWLVISTDEQMLFTQPHKRLIDALETANTLQLHIDNIEAMPIPQYLLSS